MKPDTRNGIIILGVLLFFGVMAMLPEPPPEKLVEAADAAQVGDVVTVRYPSSTIMCGTEADMSMVYVAGETARRQTMRVENSGVYAALAVEAAAQKSAMAQAYSCEWAPKDVRYVVQQKQIAGDESENSFYHVAEYCLRPPTADRCWWIGSTATSIALIEKVHTKP